MTALRTWEIDRIAATFPGHARVLELGAGTGAQARELAARGFSVEAIDLPNSLYAQTRVFPVTDYDGRTIPFPDASFDVVFSSSVLEHVPDLDAMHAEIRRVLKPDGRAIHVLPTHLWRLATTASTFLVSARNVREAAVDKASAGSLWRRVARQALVAFRQPRHGERGNFLTETWYFHPRWWRGNFRRNGFTIEREAAMGLFYTGNLAVGARWSIARREQLARSFGSVCRLFILRPAKSGNFQRLEKGLT